MHPQFRVDVLGVGGCGVSADDEFVANEGDGSAAGQQGEHLGFARSQAAVAGKAFQAGVRRLVRGSLRAAKPVLRIGLAGESLRIYARLAAIALFGSEAFRRIAVEECRLVADGQHGDADHGDDTQGGHGGHSSVSEGKLRHDDETHDAPREVSRMDENPSETGGLNGGGPAARSAGSEEYLGDEAERESPAEGGCRRDGKPLLPEEDGGGEPDDQHRAHPSIEEGKRDAPRAGGCHQRHDGHHDGAEQHDGLQRDARFALGAEHACQADDDEHAEDAEAGAAQPGKEAPVLAGSLLLDCSHQIALHLRLLLGPAQPQADSGKQRVERGHGYGHPAAQRGHGDNQQCGRNRRQGRHQFGLVPRHHSVVLAPHHPQKRAADPRQDRPREERGGLKEGVGQRQEHERRADAREKRGQDEQEGVVGRGAHPGLQQDDGDQR